MLPWGARVNLAVAHDVVHAGEEARKMRDTERLTADLPCRGHGTWPPPHRAQAAGESAAAWLPAAPGRPRGWASGGCTREAEPRSLGRLGAGTACRGLQDVVQAEGKPGCSGGVETVMGQRKAVVGVWLFY